MVLKAFSYFMAGAFVCGLIATVVGASDALRAF